MDGHSAGDNAYQSKPMFIWRRFYTFTMVDDAGREGPEWANQIITNLAKIHSTFDDGQRAIQSFKTKYSMTKPDFGFKLFDGIGASEKRDAFDEMIHDSKVEAFRKALETFDKLTQNVLRSLRKRRPVAEQFEQDVREISDLENPPKILFDIHDGAFPLQPDEFIKLATFCRKTYNTVRHISDIRQDNISRYKVTWRFFFDKIASISFTEIMASFEKMLRVLEYIETKKSEIISLEYLETQLRKYTDDPLHFAKPEIIKKALGANKWSEYIEVEHKPEYEDEDEEKLAIHQLDYLTRPGGPDYVIEVNGEGGLGKTKLVREYILRSINRTLKYRQKQYDFYLYYTAKSEQQGEVNAAIGKHFTTSPDDWAVGGGDYIHKLSFNQFIDVACRTFDLPTADAKENLLDYLKENEVLILLDNFEDVGKNDIGRYRKFFRSINAGTKSRIFITSRKDPTYGRANIELSQFDRRKAVEMLHKRYLFEISSAKTEWRTARLNELRDASELNQDLIEEIINGVSIPETYGAGIEALERNLTHPLYLRLLANILANPKVINATKNDSTLVSTIIQIIDNPEFGFWEWHESVVRWMLKHAYNKIDENIYCKAILNLLHLHPEGIDTGSIHAKFRAQFPEEKQLMTEINNALGELNDYSGFLEDDIENDCFVLTNNARKFLLEMIGVISPLPVSEKKETLEVNDIDFAYEIKTIMKNGIQKWNDVGQIIALAGHYKKDASAVDSNLLEEVEHACFEFAITDSPGIDNLGIFLEMLRLMRSIEHRIKLVIHNSSTLADEEVFSSITEDRQFLAYIIIEGSKETKEMLNDISESPHGGAMLMLMMKMLGSGIQGDLVPFFKLVNLIFEIQEEDTICSLVEDYGWSEEFGHFMTTWTQQIEWTLKSQNLFDLHASEEFTGNASCTTRFSFVKPNDIEPSWTVKLHPEGEQTFDSSQQKGFTVDWDLITTSITIYVLPEREKQPSVKIHSVADENRFSEWSSGHRKNQPGLSVDPVILASDIAITLELYNETEFREPVGFSRAQKFKELYKKIYKGPYTAHSVAFILAIRLDNSQPTTPQVLGEQLIDEYHRRLKKYDESAEHEYYESSEIDDWKKLYEGIVHDAIKLLENNAQEVIDEIDRRKSRHSSFVRPRVGTTVLGLLQDKGKNKKKSLREEFTLPEAIRTVLKVLQDRPLIRRRGFRDLMIKHGGYLHQTLKTEETDFSRRKIEEWKLYGKWIESTTSVIWNSSDEMIKKYSFSEELVRSIEEYHFKRYGA